MSGDLRTTEINLQREHSGRIWVTGLVRDLTFVLLEWVWNPPTPLRPVAFFNYSTRAGYRIALAPKAQNSRLTNKQQRLGLTQEETWSSIASIRNKYKPAKLQTFLWQINSGGLPAGSWCAEMGFPDTCLCCNYKVKKSLEHCLRGRKIARRVWQACEPVWRTLQRPPIRAWRELLTGVPPGTHNEDCVCYLNTTPFLPALNIEPQFYGTYCEPSAA